jgi:hypothetical protein
MAQVAREPSASPAAQDEPRRGAGRLWLLGLAMIVPATYFAWRYPLRGNADRLRALGGMSGYGVSEFVGWAVGIAALFALYALALRESRRVPVKDASVAVFGCGAALVAVMATMYPVNAIDLYIYAVRSRIFTGHGADPIAVAPAAFPDDPLMNFSSRQWGDDVSPYGPLWNLIAAPATLIAGDRIDVAVVALKVFAAGSTLLGAWIVYRTVAPWRPDEAATGALVYLWNPLVLWEGVGNGHNDVVLAVPLLLALLAWATRQDRWVIPLLVTATLIKYVTVLILPLAAVAIWRRAGGWRVPWRTVGWAAVASVLALSVGLFPFYDVAAIRRAIERQGDIVMTSPAALALDVFQPHYAYDAVYDWSRRLGVASVALVLLGLLLLVARRPERLPRAAFEVVFAYLLCAAWTFRPWYLIWLVALAAVQPLGWPAARTAAWTLGGLAAYGMFIWGWEWWKVEYAVVQRVAVPLMFGPALVVTGLEMVVWLAERRRGASGGGYTRQAIAPAER